MAPRRIFALVDCNSFYAACEKVFAPALAHRPVVVLSNNDGCVIARSAEAKAAGIPMGAPAFQCRSLFRQHAVAVFSSNYALYGDMSARVMQTLARFTPSLEVYSIDEAFLDLTGLPGERTAYCRRIRDTVRRWTGIPVSIGLGSTKTLAKAANRLSKLDPAFGGVLDFTTAPDPDALLEQLPVEAVWGIGRRHAARLVRRGIVNARQFRDQPRDWVKRTMTVTGLHTLLELRGTPCLDLDATAPAKHSVSASRSFGQAVTQIEAMREALAVYATRAAERLRRTRMVASGVTVWIEPSPDPLGASRSAQSGFAALPVATAGTSTLLKAALRIVERLFRPGWRYKKAGVLFSGLEPAGCRQGSLLAPAPEAQARGERLSAVMDQTNARWGRDTLRLAACGFDQGWAMKQAARSPRATTCWAEIPEVRS